MIQSFILRLRALWKTFRTQVSSFFLSRLRQWRELRPNRFAPLAGAGLAVCLVSFGIGRYTASSGPAPAAVSEAETAAIQEERSTPSERTEVPAFQFKPYVTEPDMTYAGAEAVMLPNELNLAYFFPDGADVSQVSQSSAGRLYQLLSEQEAQWFSGIYDFYNYTPLQAAGFLGLPQETVSGRQGVIDSFQTVTMSVQNGAGAAVQTTSNAREIVAVCNVLNYYGVLTTEADLEAFAQSLWDASHSYRAVVGSVYYCDGSCLTKTNAAESETTADVASDLEAETTADVASDSEAASGDGDSCPGHIDLTLQITIKSGEDGSLFDAAALLLPEEAVKAEQPEEQSAVWPGWTEETRSYINDLLAKDWYECYGLNSSDTASASPLTAEEIDFYMQLVPEGVSQVRRDFVQYALTSVGKIPYYWGGKPSRPGYTGNRFGAIVEPDESGRFLKGLDCSGWISWVYWSVTGKQLGASSTSTLLSAGTAVSREQLLPGDICIRPGDSAHVVMYLGWSGDGRMVCVQETSAQTNNVEIALVTPDWASYRRIID